MATLRFTSDADPENVLKLLWAANRTKKRQLACVHVQAEGRTVVVDVPAANLTLFKPNAAVKYLVDASGVNPSQHAVTNQWLERNDAGFAVLLRHMKETLQSQGFIVSSEAADPADAVCWAAVRGLILREPTARDYLMRNAPAVLTWFDHVDAQPELRAVVATYEQVAAPVLKLSPVTLDEARPPTTVIRPNITMDVTIKAGTTVYAVAVSGRHANSSGEGLPKDGEKNILITSALPYVNNVPHLGNIIGCVLSADVYARFCRLRGYNTLYICGTDEYGTATETKALQEGVSCQEICDRYHALHRDIYQWFDISFDLFGRTTTPHQTTIAQDIFNKLNQRGYLFEDAVEQLWCEKDQRFLADRYVEGTCPLCQYEDARGDQCDRCGHLLNAIELVKPRCKICGTSPIVRSSRHMFLNLPELQSTCDAWVEKSSAAGHWSANGIHITKGWLSEGLKPRCITRDLKWGTPVPLEGMKDKVFYVWFDAPIGYLSITANYTPDWERWWKNPDQVKLYQFMGKDNVPFHTVIFPCSLIGSGDNYTLLHHVSTTEYLNYEDGKFSKSRGVGVFGNNVMDSGIPVSVWRYYLLATRPESNDSQFTWSDFVLKTNTELLANLGNFVNRALRFLKAKFGGTIPDITLTEFDQALITNVSRDFVEYVDAMDAVKLREGLRLVMNVSRLGNMYLTEAKPILRILFLGQLDNALFESDRVRCGTIVAVAVNLVYHLASLLHPFMPGTSDSILKQVHAPLRRISTEFSLDLLPGHTIATPELLFARIDEKEAERLRKKYAGTQETQQASASASTPAPGKHDKKPKNAKSAVTSVPS